MRDAVLFDWRHDGLIPGGHGKLCLPCDESMSGQSPLLSVRRALPAHTVAAPGWLTPSSNLPPSGQRTPSSAPRRDPTGGSVQCHSSSIALSLVPRVTGQPADSCSGAEYGWRCPQLRSRPQTPSSRQRCRICPCSSSRRPAGAQAPVGLIEAGQDGGRDLARDMWASVLCGLQLDSRVGCCVA
jgi:hypothetical protein